MFKPRNLISLLIVGFSTYVFYAVNDAQTLSLTTHLGVLLTGIIAFIFFRWLFRYTF